ncbi:hypothetical protein CRG98_044235, partial [Punica granatum]
GPVNSPEEAGISVSSPGKFRRNCGREGVRAEGRGLPSLGRVTSLGRARRAEGDNRAVSFPRVRAKGESRGMSELWEFSDSRG